MLTLPMTVKMSDIVSSAAYKPQQEPQEQQQQQQPQQQQPAGDELEDVQSALLVTEYYATALSSIPAHPGCRTDREKPATVAGLCCMSIRRRRALCLPSNREGIKQTSKSYSRAYCRHTDKQVHSPLCECLCDLQLFIQASLA
jgi:hypothetical protein